MSADWLKMGETKRDQLAETCPGMPATREFFTNTFNKLAPVFTDFASSHFDF